MASTSRRSAVATGQLVREFRNRDKSGFQSVHLEELKRLFTSIGAPVYAFGSTAAALHRFESFALRPPFHVVVPRGRNITRIGHHVHTSEHLDPIDREEVLGFAVTSPARTLIDLATDTPPKKLTVALDGSLRDGLVVERFLHERIEALRTKGRYGVPNLLAVIEGSEIDRGCHSWLEREYMRLIGEAGLPIPDAQQVLGRRGNQLIRVDFRFPGTPVVVEVLGYRWHRTTAQMAVDAARINELMLTGHLPFQFTYSQVVAASAGVVATTAAALTPFLTGLCVTAQSDTSSVP